MSDSDEFLKIGSLDAKLVCIVGMVQRVRVHTTKVTLTVTDNTSRSIEVHRWLGDTEAEPKESDFPVDEYIKVVGSVRSVRGQRFVVAHSLRPLEHLNELTAHMAEVMTVAGMEKKSSSPSSYVLPPEKQLTKLQQMVKDVINGCLDERGIHRDEIFNNLKSFTRQSVQDALEFLECEGHVYASIDEDHLKTTDSIF